jgi:hypothetical protein
MACAALLLAPAARAADPPSLKEFELKAAYVYNFIKFTGWPNGAFADESAPIVVGVMADERTGAALMKLVKGHPVNHRDVIVRMLSRRDEFPALHVLYVDNTHEAALRSIAPLFAKPGLLTVGESEQFTELGGAIRLLVEGDRLQFEISAAAAQRVGLSLSSQLLMLAKSVRKPEASAH